MPIFHIRIGREARVYYSAKVEAGSIEEVKNNLGRHDYNGPVIGEEWNYDGADDYADLETFSISDEKDGEELAFWSDLGGWEGEA